MVPKKLWIDISIPNALESLDALSMLAARHQVNSLRALVPGVSSALCVHHGKQIKGCHLSEKKTGHDVRSNKTQPSIKQDGNQFVGKIRQFQEWFNNGSIHEKDGMGPDGPGWARMGRSVANTFPQGNASPVATSQL